MIYPPTKVYVVCDLIIFTILNDRLNALLILRKNPPFQNYWALPGGFINEDEPLEQAALRELKEETGVQDVYIEQLYTFGDPKRDTRGRVISVAYYALIGSDKLKIRAGTDAGDARWFDIKKLPALAFDHKLIIKMAIKRLRSKLSYSTVGFQLLPARFTLSQLQRLYEAILDKKLDKRNFRRKVLSLNLLKEARLQHTKDAHRPAKLYSFKLNSTLIIDGLIRG